MIRREGVQVKVILVVDDLTEGTEMGNMDLPVGWTVEADQVIVY